MSFAGAILLWAALPPVDWWPLAWVAPVPWIMLIRWNELPGRRPYRVLTLAGFCFWMAVLHWMRLPHPATSVGWVALSAYFAFYLPLFVGLSRLAVHRLRVPVILAAPIIWTGLELARAHLLTGMTMASLGHTQYRWVGLIQLSDLAGAFGVGFVVMFVAACLARMIPEYSPASPPLQRWTVREVIESLWPLAPAGAMLAAALIYGHVRMNADCGSPGPRIALIQGSIDVTMQHDPDLKDSAFTEYYDLSRQAVAENRSVDLVVWPEAMFVYGLVTYDEDAKRPAYYKDTDDEFRRQLRESRQSWTLLTETAQSLGAPLLIGADMYSLDSEGDECFNSAAYVDRKGRLLGSYGKMHLVMFGEYVPFGQYFPSLQRLTPLPVNVTPGQRPVAFDLSMRSDAGWDGSCTAGPQPSNQGRQYNCRPNKICRIAPNICYESVLSHVIRGQINTLTAEGKEPEVLVNLTNDGWYWGSSELDLHLACGVFRAVECRKPFLIAANTGFSAWIDADGRLREQGPRRAKAVLLAEPRIDTRYSWYLAHGDWFAGVCLAACVLCGLVGIFGRVRGRVSAAVV
jgi:apolipoprotein N-acyltransferase